MNKLIIKNLRDYNHDIYLLRTIFNYQEVIFRSKSKDTEKSLNIIMNINTMRGVAISDGYSKACCWTLKSVINTTRNKSCFRYILYVYIIYQELNGIFNILDFQINFIENIFLKYKTKVVIIGRKLKIDNHVLLVWKHFPNHIPGTIWYCKT